MPNEKIDIAKYTHYFNINAPSASIQLVLFLVLGALAGITSGFIIHAGIGNSGYTSFLLSAAVAGIMIITVPALLTARKTIIPT